MQALTYAIGGVYALGLSLAHWKITHELEKAENEERWKQQWIGIHAFAEECKKQGMEVQRIQHRGCVVDFNRNGEWTHCFNGDSMVALRKNNGWFS